jgi:hypothetical protein
MATKTKKKPTTDLTFVTYYLVDDIDVLIWSACGPECKYVPPEDKTALKVVISQRAGRREAAAWLRKLAEMVENDDRLFPVDEGEFFPKPWPEEHAYDSLGDPPEAAWPSGEERFFSLQPSWAIAVAVSTVD